MSEKAKIKISDDLSVDVVDPHHIQPVYADLVTEVRVFDGVLYLSLANIIIDGDSPVERKAQVCARLRIRGGTAQLLNELLTKPNEEKVPAGQTIN